MVRMENDPKKDTGPAVPSSDEPDMSETQPNPGLGDVLSFDETRPHNLWADELGSQAETQAVPIQHDNLEETRPLPAADLSPQTGKPQAEEPAAGKAPSGSAQSGLPAAESPAGDGGAPPAPPESLPTKPRRSWRWLLYVGLGLLLMLAIGAVSSYGGYLSAIDLRLSFQATQVNEEAQHQFDLGMVDLEAGRFDLARQRFEYVIQLNPNFPGVTEVLAQVLLAINITATPTFAPTPTLSPTPDLRGQEDLYLQAREFMAGADWTAAIDTLLTLRKRYPEYMTVDVDGLLYIALRNRGVQKISVQADLEGGTYDLTLARGFGPLDVEARNWRDWAVLYTRGASFWDVDWQQAVFYFSQLAQIAPNLMDASRLTAVERYTLALIGYGDWLARQELWCDAQEQYQLSFNLRGSPEVEPTASYVAEQCANPQPSGGSSGVVTLTPTLTATAGGEVTPTSTSPAPAATPTATNTPPAATPTPTFTATP